MNNNETKCYKGAIFDLDGTLLDTLDDLWDAVNVTMTKFGYPERTREEVRAFVGNGVNRLIELSVPGGGEDPHLEDAITEYRAHYDAHSENKTKPYEGIAELLGKLREAGIACAVVSNKMHSATVTLCAKYFPEIPVVIGEQEAAGIRRKPHPDTVFKALAEMGMQKEDCVYIGDSEVDVATAKNAGMDCISVLWGFRDRPVLEAQGAGIFASTVEELAGLLLNGTK